MFLWTKKKNRDNKQKHGFYFSEILGVFEDSHLVELYDEAHSSMEENRYITIGFLRDKVIAVVNTDTFDGNTRLISARKADPKETRIYYENYK